MASSPPVRYAGAVVAVTGAGGQIGRALMADLAARGAQAYGIDLPGSCPVGDERYLPCDITDEAELQATFGQIGRRHERLDLLVHSAGLSAIGRFTDHDLATHRRVMEVTHFGVVAVTLAALPLLRAAAGRVVVIGSVAGFAPVLGRPPYVAAKHAVTGLFEALRPELAQQGIAVTLCHPTFVTGGMSEAATRAGGVDRATTGPEITPADVSRTLLDALARGADLVLVGRTARLSWLLSRHTPQLFARAMTRRLRATASSRPHAQGGH